VGVSSDDEHPGSRLVAAWRPIDDWTTLEGHEVEFHQRGRIIDVGTVESVTADGTILWLKLEGAVPRRIVLKQLDIHARLASAD
jgi:hypothetical protein